MSWIILFCAGLFEVGWAVGLKYTDGFTRPLPTLLTVTAMIISLGLLGLAPQTTRDMGRSRRTEQCHVVRRCGEQRTDVVATHGFRQHGLLRRPQHRNPAHC